MLNASGIFFDSTNLEEFKKWHATHILGGATTNPLIVKREGTTDIAAVIAQMVHIAGKHFPISVEIPDTAMTKSEMVRFARMYHKRFPDNIVIKVPMDPREPHKAFEVMYDLGQLGIRVNATIGLSIGQLIGASEALRHSRASGDNYISLFWSRRNEAKDQIMTELVKKGMKKKDALEAVPDAAQTLVMTLRYLETHNSAVKTIVGSIRSVDQIEQAFAIGADIVAIPPKLLTDWMYTRRGVETVEEFNRAYRAAQKKR